MAIVLGGIVLVNARSISRNIKAWQAERAAAESTRLLAAQDFTGARAKLQDALALSPENPAAQLAAARFLTTAGNHRDATGLDALVVLARRSANAKSAPLPSENTQSPSAIADAIDANPLARARHALFAMDLRLLEEPLRKPEMIAAAEAKFTGNDDDLEALTAWLYGKGEFRKILLHLPPKIASHRRTLYLQSLDAMAALGEWKSVADAINGASFNLDRVTAEMYLARCSKELGEKVAMENHWNAALEAAQGNIQQLILVADYADKAGNLPIAQKAYLATTEARGDFLPAYQRLLAID